MMTEGRSCPLAYRYRPGDLCAEPEVVNADVLYVIGGLYGNPYALDEIERMAAEEKHQGRSVTLVFNGDFNWFNASDQLFRELNERVLKHTVSLGNVEYELANPNDGAGCGCAYPRFVDQGMLDHFGITRQQIFPVKGVEKRGMDQNHIGNTERTDLVFETVEIDARLPSHRCINHRQQGCGKIDKRNSPFVSRGSKTSKVANHATAQVDQE